MSRRLDWPALHGFEPQPLFDEIAFARAVWGKVHGAPTDFRWIARTVDFAGDRRDLQSQLNLGDEDTPASFQAWRNQGDRCYALSGYASRSIDASSRRGFLEKQILEWCRPEAMPAALGALLLLPHVAQGTDAVWWERGAALVSAPDTWLAMENDEPLHATEDLIAATIERGRGVLRDRVPRPAIEQLYEQLLARRSPALLGGVPQPLPAEALAALLLPLPREVADRLSVAGWIPSSRPSMSDLATRWDVIVTAQAPAAGSVSAQAQQLAAMLLDGTALAPASPLPAPMVGRTPQRSRPRMRLHVTPPDAGASRLLNELYDFAAAADRRWLSPDKLELAGVRPFRPDEAPARLLRAWVRQVQQDAPPHADAEQWAVKVDLLRSAAIVLVPHSSTVAAVGLPSSNRVPSLLFGLMLDKGGRKDLQRLDETSLHQLLTQTVGCRSSHWTARMRPWLEQWQRENGGNTIGVLLRDALSL